MVWCLPLRTVSGCTQALAQLLVFISTRPSLSSDSLRGALANADPLLSVTLGVVFGLLSSLFLFSTYYVAWFLMLAGIVILILCLVFAPRVMITEVITGVKTGWRSLSRGDRGIFSGHHPVRGHLRPRST